MTPGLFRIHRRRRPEPAGRRHGRHRQRQRLRDGRIRWRLSAFGDATQPVVGIAHYSGYWLQGNACTWSTYCADVASASLTALWGSNLEDSSSLHADSTIRVEVALLDMAATGEPYHGYVGTNLTPTLDDRYATYGTDSSTVLSDGADLAYQTHVWAPDTGTTSAGTAYSLDTSMGAEVNSTGAVVYGFRWGGGKAGTTTPAGTYTLTFTVGGTSTTTTGVTTTGVVPGSVAQPTYDRSSTSIQVTVK